MAYLPVPENLSWSTPYDPYDDKQLQQEELALADQIQELLGWDGKDGEDEVEEEDVEDDDQGFDPQEGEGGEYDEDRDDDDEGRARDRAGMGGQTNQRFHDD